MTSEEPFSNDMTAVSSALQRVFNSTVSAVGFCNAEVNIDTPHGIYNWSETEVGKNATNRCVYNTTEQFGLARRRCTSPRQWDDYYGDQCITRNTHRIQRINEVSITLVLQNIGMSMGSNSLHLKNGSDS